MLLLFALIFRAVSMEFRSKTRVAGVARASGTARFFAAQLRRHAPLRRRRRQRDDRHPARRSTANFTGGAPRPARRPTRCSSGVLTRRDLRHARRDLPLPEDRGRAAAAHPRLDVAHVRALPGRVHAHDDRDSSPASRARPRTSARYPWAWVVVVAERARHRQHPPRDLPRQAGPTRSSPRAATIAASRRSVRHRALSRTW